MVDTCSTISTIEFNDPTQNRIFKVGKRIKYNRIRKEKDASTVSKGEDDKETASEKREISQNGSDKAPQRPSSEGDELSASAIDAGDTWKRMLEKPDRSVKYNDKVIRYTRK